MKKKMSRPLIYLLSAAGVYAVVQLLVSLGVISPYLQLTLSTIIINIILALGLNLVTGFTGQFSLGHAGFMSIGAYACAIFLRDVSGSFWGFVAGAVLGGLLAALAGLVVGLPTLRLRGDYLAIATLGMAEIIRVIFNNLMITNRAAGISNIPRMSRYIPALGSWPWLFLCAAITLLVIVNFIRSSHGRACLAIREDEIAAEAMGVNTTRYKVIAFIIGAFFAGIAGALYAGTFSTIQPKTFDFNKSIEILIIVVFGGMGSISGTVIAAFLLAVLSTVLQSFADIRMIIYSLLLVIIMIFRPQGIMGSKELSVAMFKRAGGSLRKLFSGKGAAK